MSPDLADPNQVISYMSYHMHSSSVALHVKCFLSQPAQEESKNAIPKEDEEA